MMEIMEIMEMILRLAAVIFLAVTVGKAAAKLKMPAVLGFLIAGMALGPHGLRLLNQNILDNMAYHTLISFLECGMGLIFGGIALATAPAPALSIVTEYKTDGPITKTLIPLAVIDDVIAICVFLSVMGVILPHSGVSLVLTGIAISALTGDYGQYGDIVRGTIAAATVINEIIAVFVARKGFQLAGEMRA